MIAEKLITPHPNKSQPELGPKPLLEKLDLNKLKSELTISSQFGPEAYQAQKVEAARQIADEVFRALWYPMNDKKRNDFEDMGISEPVTLDDIEVQAANCYGYAYVTSEIFDEVGIEHWIGYAGGPLPHAFLLLPPSAGTEVDGIYYVDPYFRDLSHEMDRSIQRIGTPRLIQEVDANGRSAFMLNAYNFAAELGERYSDMSAQLPWLVYAKDQNHHYREQKTQSRHDRKHLIVATVYDSVTGKDMLDAYGRYKQAIETDDKERAIQMIERLAGIFPSIDARQDHQDIRILVDWLACQGRTSEALDTLNNYFKSFELSSDTRIPETYADIQLQIAQRVGSAALAETAEVIYITTHKKPKCFKDRVASKIQKARAAKDDLAYKNEAAG